MYTNIYKQNHTYNQSMLVCCLLTLQHKATNCFNKSCYSKSHYSVAHHKGFSQKRSLEKWLLQMYHPCHVVMYSLSGENSLQEAVQHAAGGLTLIPTLSKLKRICSKLGRWTRSAGCCILVNPEKSRAKPAEVLHTDFVPWLQIPQLFSMPGHPTQDAQPHTLLEQHCITQRGCTVR